jgi:single-strand DNA-binding protein
MNSVTLIGRLTADPKLKYTQNAGIPFCSFNLAVDRRYKNAKGEREADFIRIIAWRKLAEICVEHLFKGNKVAISGSLEVNRWEGEDGNPVTIYQVVAENVEFLTPRKDGGNGGGGNGPANEPDYGPPPEDDDLPF